jgi:hypothetical protein
MESVLRYRGRSVGQQEIAFLRELIASRPEASRRAISIDVCNAWRWAQPNGTLCDALCRGLLLALHRGGAIELPAPKKRVRVAAWHRRIRHGF